MPGTTVTVRDALRTGAERLALRGDLQENARQDAQQLLEIATGLSRVQMLSRPEAALPQEEFLRFEALLLRRLEAVPIQYLRGSQEFYGRSFRVTPDVLIPRPETEDAVTAVLELVEDRSRTLAIADVGTGSGVLAITLALELPNSRVTAIDVSAAALDVARENAALLGQVYDCSLRDRICFLQSNLFQAVSPAERFDVIVSNPPYIPLTESASLHPQVRDYEPHLALFGGEDGHAIYRQLISNAQNRLLERGVLVLETPGRVDLLRAMLRDWTDVTCRPDLHGNSRIVVATRP